jgi:DNA-binding HxlR family transcriptional regulator
MPKYINLEEDETLDKYCTYILRALMINWGKIRFNELIRVLKENNVKMSKPTTVQHLNHLLKKKIIKRMNEGKQKVTYTYSEALIKYLQTNYRQKLEELKTEENKFKSKNLEDQVKDTLIQLTLDQIKLLAFHLLKITNSKEKLQINIAYIETRLKTEHYINWLTDTCKKTPENYHKAITIINQYMEQPIKTNHISTAPKRAD